MKALIKLNSAVVVEGKYDKIRLENIVDAPIFTTDGFRIFKDAEKMRKNRNITTLFLIFINYEKNLKNNKYRWLRDVSLKPLTHLCFGSSNIVEPK